MNRLPEYNTQSGFTLVEILIVLLVSGFILSAAISAFYSAQDILNKRTTEARMAVVQDALAAYAARNYRIPCPGDPAFLPNYDGREGNAAALSDIDTCTDAGDETGLVPYAVVGLDLEDVQDAHGNFFTYVINPVFAADPLVAVNIHQKCRTDLWIEAGRNQNVRKARFCCRDASAAAIRVCHVDANANQTCDAAERILFPSTLPPAGEYDAEDTQDDYARTPPPAQEQEERYDDNITTLAYVLISHGENAEGAWDRNGVRLPLPAAGDIEGENTNGDTSYFSLPFDLTEDATYFDDILRWETQTGLLARLKRDSCEKP